MDETEEFVCDICGKECEELWQFGTYGDNPLKKADDKNYCKAHFLEADLKYDSIEEDIPEDN